MSKLRFRVVETAFKKKPVAVAVPAERPSEYFAKYVFNKEKMFRYLPSKVYAKLTDVIDNGAPLDRSIADEVAAGMKKWAVEMGATHYTHWFHPLTEGTAEKHDAFVEHDGKGGVMEEFTGKLLVQQEPDASSFPNGGIRNTFEARGYSAWDPSSPAFIVDDTLCIPTIFIAYTGESLDYKAPLLKALRAVDKAAVDVCHYFNPEVKKVVAYLGWEQEYFLVDEGLYAARPDLLMTGQRQEPAVGRPLLRGHPQPCGRFHEGTGNRSAETRHPRQDPSQRSGSQPVRAGSRLRGMQPGGRPQHAHHGLDA